MNDSALLRPIWNNFQLPEPFRSHAAQFVQSVLFCTPAQTDACQSSYAPGLAWIRYMPGNGHLAAMPLT